MLFTPEELGWLAAFTKELREKVPARKWTELLYLFQQLGVALPADCRCDWNGDRRTWLHQNHAAFNIGVRAAIVGLGAREGLHTAMYRALWGGGDVTINGRRYLKGGPMLSREHGETLLDFLRVEPTKEWFRAPVPLIQKYEGYQGSALKDQERNPGLSN